MLTTKIAGFWEVTPYNLVEFYRCSLPTYREGIREAELKNENWKRFKEKQRHRKYNQRQQAGRQKKAGKRRAKK
jgi:hypothetical protein